MAWASNFWAPSRRTSVRTSLLWGSGRKAVSVVESVMVAYSLPRRHLGAVLHTPRVRRLFSCGHQRDLVIAQNQETITQIKGLHVAQSHLRTRGRDRDDRD